MATDLIKRITSLPPGERKLVEEFIRSRIGPKKNIPPVVGASSDDYLASFPQQGIWMAQQMTPASAVFNMVWQFTITAAIDPGNVQQWMNRIVQRHETLRTCFHVRNRDIRAVVLPIKPVEISVNSPPIPGAPRQAGNDLEWLGEYIRTPFDLASGVLIRVGVCPHSQSATRIYVIVHHIAFDAWSATVLAGEISELCFGSGNLPPLRCQYSEYANWQHRRKDEPMADTSLEYWRKVLSPPLAITTIAEDRARKSIRRGQGGRIPINTDPSTVALLRNVGLASGCTLFTVFLAAFKALLMRYTEQQDIVVGTLSANRTERRFEGLIGCFINTIVLRTSVSASQTLHELVSTVGDTVRGAMVHPHTPFQNLVSDLAPARIAGYQPLVQVMFVMLQDSSIRQMGQRSVLVERLDNGAASYDLTCTLVESRGSDNYSGWIEYDVDLYEPGTIKRLADYYGQVLYRVAVTPDLTIGELPAPSTSTPDLSRKATGKS